MLTIKEKDAAERFWQWFAKNHLMYEFFAEMSEQQRAEIAEKLKMSLAVFGGKVRASAMAGLKKEESFRVVISANGDRNFFQKAKDVTALAPEIPGWTVYALEPPLPRTTRIRLQYGGHVIDPNEIWMHLMEVVGHPGYLGLHVATKLHDLFDQSQEELDNLKQVLMGLTSRVIGEESWAYDVQYFQIGPMPAVPMEEGMFEMYDLPDAIASFRKEFPRPNLD